MNFSNLGHRESENSRSNHNVIKKTSTFTNSNSVYFENKNTVGVGELYYYIVLILMHYASTI